jgi:putative sigma-54 modulation protein
MMQLHFVGKNIDVTPALKEITTQKLQTLEKHFHHINKINIVFEVDHVTQIAEATVFMNGAEIHAAAKDVDLYKAIDMLVAKLTGQITKHKEKIIDSHR